MKRFLIAVLLIATYWSGPSRLVAAAPAWHIDCEFLGGNIIVDRLDGDTAHVRQDLRDTQGWWFYWYFRVRGAEGRKLKFQFKDRAIGLRGPGVSRDGGRTWAWLGRRESATAFTYSFALGETEVRFSFGMPYQHADLQRFLATWSDHPDLRTEVFAHTRKGTPVELLRLGRLDEPRFKVWITCRHHACEMMASYVLEGMIAEVLAESAAGQWLRRNVGFLIVPMVDKDGVEAGDQGKNRLPRDHGQDYTGPSVYPEVAALRRLVREWAPDGPEVTLDLHNPSINHQFVYTHALRHDRDDDPWNNAHDTPRSRARRFLNVLEQVRSGPLPFLVQDSLDFAAQKAKESAARGQANVPPGAARGADSISASTPSAPETRGFRCTFEVPYAVVREVEVNADTARAFGRDLTRALYVWFESLPSSVSP